MECPSCQARISKDWAHCPKCGADLETGHYSSLDDPLEKLKKRVDKIDNFLTDEFGEEETNESEPPNPEPTPRTRKRAGAKKQRKTLFGD